MTGTIHIMSMFAFLLCCLLFSLTRAVLGIILSSQPAFLLLT